ncbi:hypothetical protein PanWU01x14_349260 [Parasponia andersonii]|uniref:Uncharacterized protein n=1 Tax=Parasponia andersonii TaxID=3476 RepID=A0A2P5ABD2_PARAD|nr:hypothetical protein PanWU01x14_349260 [Parasponia andersonii]
MMVIENITSDLITTLVIGKLASSLLSLMTLFFTFITSDLVNSPFIAGEI